jgi:hypothetical protein
VAKSVFSLRAIGEGIAGAAFMLFTIMLSPLLRTWYCRWNAAPEEIELRMPGDNLVPIPMLTATRAITIRAPAVVIWPWLVQIGYKRAGWYSYDFLEAVMGAADFVDGHSAYRIVPELQHLHPGDTILIHPRIPGFVVREAEAGKLLILHNAGDLETGKPFDLESQAPRRFINDSWVFYLETLDEKTTRLIVRSRLAYNSSPSNFFFWRILTDPISFVMERKLLLGIKWRAESTERRPSRQKVPAGIPVEMYK